jgi:hypothetical protein
MGAAKVVCVKELFSFIFKTTSFFDDWTNSTKTVSHMDLNPLKWVNNSCDCINSMIYYDVPIISTFDLLINDWYYSFYTLKWMSL